LVQIFGTLVRFTSWRNPMLTSSKYVSVNATGCAFCNKPFARSGDYVEVFGGHQMVVISVQSFAQTTPRKHNSRTSTVPLHTRWSMKRR
jgi:uncharacterized protein YcgI (DUF1989 family)